MTPPGRRSPRAIMYVYAWDIWDEGTEAVADRLHACGVDAVQIAVSYHIGSYLLPRNPRRVLYFGDHGALYYRPSPSVAETSGVLPPVSSSLGGLNALPTVLGGLQRAGIARFAWMVYAYNHALARARPDLSVRSVFGDHSQAQLCTVNPAFHRYAVAVTEDVLDRFALDGLVVESLSALPYDYGFLNPKLGIVPSRAAAFLLGVCWCEACMAAASTRGVVAARLAEAVRDWLRKHLNALPDDELGGSSVQSLLAGPFGDDLRAYRAAQVERTTALHRDVLRAAAQRNLLVGSTTAERGQSEIDSALSVEAVAPLVNDARVPLEPGVRATTIAARVRALRETLPAVEAVYGLLQIEQFESRVAFDGTIAAAREAGLRHFRFYNYGLLSETQLGWLEGGKRAWA